jgi:integrase
MAVYRRVSKTTGKVSWQAVLERRDPSTGERDRLILGTYRLKKDAEKAIRDEQSMRDRGTAVDPSKVTVAEVLGNWLRTTRTEVRPQTAAGYEITIRKHLVPALGSVPVQKLSAARLQQQYNAWHDAGVGTRTIRNCHMSLSQALDQAMRHNIVVTNVCTSVRAPRDSPKRAEVWNSEQLRNFLAVAQDDGMHPLWHLLASTGMRRQEALGLRWQDVNWERGTVHIVQTVIADIANRGAALIQQGTKTRAGARTVRLSPDTVALLKEYREEWAEKKLAASVWADNDLIVCTSKGTPINPNNVTRSFDALVKLAGVPDITVHGIRHTRDTTPEGGCIA